MRIGDIYTDTGKTLRPRDEHDHYPTPRATIETYLAAHPLPSSAPHVLDPGAGSGVWGEVVRAHYPDAHITGVELRSVPANAAYNVWGTADYLEWERSPVAVPTGLYGYDVIIGNPPYKYAEEFIWHSATLAAPGGEIIFLLRLAFLASQRRYKSMFTARYNPARVTVLSNRPSFTGDGKTYPTDFAIFRWKLDGVQRDTVVDWIL